ncbi:MAG: hypothetical protein IIX30_05955 [Clostridia bacterium]|nr:hypothetical protein [Clostridia bacterium]
MDLNESIGATLEALDPVKAKELAEAIAEVLESTGTYHSYCSRPAGDSQHSL